MGSENSKSPRPRQRLKSSAETYKESEKKESGECKSFDTPRSIKSSFGSKEEKIRNLELYKSENISPFLIKESGTENQTTKPHHENDLKSMNFQAFKQFKEDNLNPTLLPRQSNSLVTQNNDKVKNEKTLEITESQIGSKQNKENLESFIFPQNLRNYSTQPKPQSYRKSEQYKTESIFQTEKEPDINYSSRKNEIEKLDELLEKNKGHPENMILSFDDPNYELDNLLNKAEMDIAIITKLTAVLNEAFVCNSIETMIRNKIEKIVESNYFKQLHNVISTDRSNLKLIEGIINLCTRFLILHPICRVKLGPIKDRLELFITDEKLKELIDNLVKLDQDVIKRNQSQSNSKSKIKNYVDYTNIEPPNDFTEMNIVPKLTDILSTDQTNQYLRKNLKNGAYQSVNHYLDVQFRLLREDFLCPLREGVQKIREIVNEARLVGKINNNALSKDIMRRICRIESLSAYFDCSIEVSLPTDQGMVYQVRLNDKAKSINWDASKRLLFGSLICMSNDYFQNECLIGCICDRDTQKLREGILWVKFNIDFENQMEREIKFGNNFILIETSAFFESYKYVLQALVSFQRDGEANFPFKENIIYCQNDSMPMPKYLTNKPIDFRPLVDKYKSFITNTIFIRESRSIIEENQYQFSYSSNYAKACYLSNQASWPSAEQMGLDKSQYSAIRLALENKLALIQGPPGTGKTFIGVKIVELLLHNKHTWWKRDLDEENIRWNRFNERRRPILMICYTNHALDQFLEYCVDQCKLTSGVVRVGGQSKSEKLRRFQLSTIKFNKRKDRAKNYTHQRLQNAISNLEASKNQLENASIILWKVSRGEVVLKLDALLKYISESHRQQFENQSSINDAGFFLDWLGLFQTELTNLKNDENNRTNENVDNFKDENKADCDKCEEIINDNENDARMLEEGTKSGIDIERRFAEINSTKCKEFISCVEIEEIRQKYLLGNDKNLFKNVLNKRQKRNKKLKTEVEKYLQNMIELYGNTNIHKVSQESNINDLEYFERFVLYWSWVEKYKLDKQKRLEQLSRRHNQHAQIVQKLRLEVDKETLEEAYIVAMTTTGSSRYHEVLKEIGPRIVLVEEAAEVFESHIVASLSKNCEHLILIGDHVQLRPSPTVYKLAKDFNFDVSLFERLINNNTKKVTLTSQHRMRPEISQLMKNFYDVKIEDHNSVNGRDDIVGLKNNIFFITHNNLEDREKNQDEASTTKINRHEAEFAVKLAEYLLKQRQFEPEQITILTMYLGQMSEMRKQQKRFGVEKVKCMTVDNYQGEENEIIILSLVRSNHENKIGFLNVKNRACVALSRARCGLYVIGNFEFICKNETGNTWKEAVKIANNIGSYGSKLTVSCGMHPNNDKLVSKPSDFDSRSDGGCHLPCDYRLKCGHQCSLRCHPFDREHKKYICTKRCEKEMKCGHKCQQTCSHEGECNQCSISVKKQIAECGHEIRIRCDEKPLRKHCYEPCKEILACSHKCIRRCGDFPCGSCQVLCEIKLSCRHGGIKMVECAERENAMSDLAKLCNKPCGARLECGHICKGSCADCLGGYIHRGCTDNKESDEHLLFCGHKSIHTSICSNMILPCIASCKNNCKHSKCHLNCSDPCIPCQEPCAYKCDHFECTKTCSELCDRPVCNSPCPKPLKCKHACIGFCGEPCPPLCFICNIEEVYEIVFGKDESKWIELDQQTRFVWLEDCGHCIESKVMDHWMKSTYGSKNTLIQLPTCPRCKTAIRHNLRYSNYIKPQLALIEKIKLKYYGDLKANNGDVFQLKNEINDLKNAKIPLLYSYYPTLLSKKINFYIVNKDRTNYSTLSYNELVSCRNLLTIYYKIGKLFERMNKQFVSTETALNDKKKQFVRLEFAKLVTYLVGNKPSTNLDETMFYSRQKVEEILNQLERIEVIINYFTFENEAQKAAEIDVDKRSKIAILLIQIDDHLIKNINQYKGVTKKQVEENFEDLKTYFKVKFTKEERPVILEPILMEKGPWHRCPNGHPFPVDSKCLECN